MSKAFPLIALLLLIAGLGWLGLCLDWSSEYIAGILSFITATFAAIYTHMTTKEREIESHKLAKEREIESRHFTEKRAVYLHFIGFIFRLFEAQKKPGGIKEVELVKEMTKFKQNLLVWGSPDVINSYNAFEDSSEVLAASQDTAAILRSVEKLYRAIRKDLGHDDRLLPEGELVGLMLNAESKKQFRESFKNG
jgi:hypothetical protein